MQAIAWMPPDAAHLKILPAEIASSARPGTRALAGESAMRLARIAHFDRCATKRSRGSCAVRDQAGLRMSDHQ